MKLPKWSSLLSNAEKGFVLFSGGKDSSAALAFSKELMEFFGFKVDLTALYVETTAGLPGSSSFVEEFCRDLEVKLEVLRPSQDYFTLAEKWGVPRPRARWCCFHLKIQPIKEYLSQFDKSDYVVLDGLRREESRKRSNYPPTYMHRHFGLVIHPIIDWTKKQVDDYLNEKGLPINPAYDFGFSSWECWCGVYKSKSEFKKLKEVAPEFFDKLVDLESKLKSGYAYAYFGGEPFYLREL